MPISLLIKGAKTTPRSGSPMFLLGATIILMSAAFSQSAEDMEVVAAVKSPTTLARYVESHKNVDWKALRRSLGLKDSEYWLAPCGSNFPAADALCVAETVTVANPEQAIVIIRGGDLSFTDEYLRYIRGPNDAWKFAGENSAFKRNGPSDHTLLRFGPKPFLKISSNHSQIGFGVRQEVEDWFDLTLPDFDPVFSFTSDGSAGGFEFTLARDIKARSNFSREAPLERIETSLNVRFGGTPGLDVEGTYVGVYERYPDEQKFTLRTAYSDLGRHTTIPTQDFEDLSDPFADPAKETFMVYALPGLKKIATGSNNEDRGWLRDVLDNAKESPEKRMLLELLGKP